MNTAELAVGKPKDETKDNTDFKNKLANFINPFYVSFVIFWVICNYDFLLILIGKKAILHELYAHFGYGCRSGKEYVACTGKKLWILNFPLYFAMWKVTIPLGLTYIHTYLVYPKIIAKINVRDKLNKENEGKEIKTNANLRKENKELIDRIAELEEESMKDSLKTLDK